MIKITITENQGNQRLDRFLKKYFDNAPLSHIYKMIRKDIKVNGKKVSYEILSDICENYLDFSCDLVYN